MFAQSTALALERCTTFGDLLRYARRRAGLTQRELSIAVGYSEAQISRLEQNQRFPDPAIVTARFLPALGLQSTPEVAARLVELAAAAGSLEMAAPGLAPFKGLLPFDETDAPLFFGREALTEALVSRLISLGGPAADETARKAGDLRFLGLVGPSGCGKSSLVRAGLLPALRRHAITAHWPIHLLTPTSQPLRALAATVAGAVTEDELAGMPSALADALAAEASRAGADGCLLLVDQFEELFTVCRLAEPRAAFVTALLAAAADGPALVVVVLRADYYSQCATFPRLSEALARSQAYIGPMTASELRHAIEEPARRGGWEFEPGLVDLFLRDVGADGEQPADPGALPLLSHALRETWERRRGRQMTLSAYASAGGVRGAIAETAEMVMQDRLDERQRAIARRIFLGLTQPGDAGQVADARRRAPLAELLNQPEPEPAVHAVLTILADARLIVMDEHTAQIAHESLLREWPTLRTWLEEDRDRLRWRRQVAAAAADWEALGRDPNLLYRGARLAHVLDWSEALYAEAPPSAQVDDFLATSRALAEAEAAEVEARHRAEIDAAWRLAKAQQARAEEQVEATRRLNRLVTALTAVLLLSLALGGLTLYLVEQNSRQALAAQRALRLAHARELAEAALGQLERDPELSLLLALQSVTTTYGVDGLTVLAARSALLQALGTTPIQLPASAATGARVGVFDAAGARLAVCGPDDVWRVWDLVGGRPVFTVPVLAPRVFALAFSPDGTQLAALTREAAGQASITAWDLTSGQTRSALSLAAPLDSSDLTALSADGRRAAILSAQSHQLIVWDLDTGSRLAGLAMEGAPPTAIALDQDGQRLAAGWPDGALQVWEVNAGASPLELMGRPGAIRLIVFAPDGTLLASAAEDGRIQVWDLGARDTAAVLAGPAAGLRALAFSADSAHLLTADPASAVQVFLLRLDEAMATAHARVRRSLTTEECQLYLHVPTCPASP